MDVTETGPDSQYLVAAVHRGDAAALDALMRRHLPDLRVFVRAKSGPQLRAQESCSDLVQTVCREALQSVERYEWRGEGSFRRWLFTLALNKLRNRADYTPPNAGTQPGSSPAPTRSARLPAASGRVSTPSPERLPRSSKPASIASRRTSAK